MNILEQLSVVRVHLELGRTESDEKPDKLLLASELSRLRNSAYNRYRLAGPWVHRPQSKRHETDIQSSKQSLRQQTKQEHQVHVSHRMNHALVIHRQCNPMP